MDWLEAAKSFGLPILGTVAGFVATSYAVKNDVKQLKLKVRALEKGWKLELDSHKDDNDGEHNELRESLEKHYKELKEQLKAIEDNIHRWQRDSSTSFASDEELNRFIEEQQKQWQAIQRTLGQIEGALRHRR